MGARVRPPASCAFYSHQIYILCCIASNYYMADAWQRQQFHFNFLHFVPFCLHRRPPAVWLCLLCGCFCASDQTTHLHMVDSYCQASVVVQFISAINCTTTTIVIKQTECCVCTEPIYLWRLFASRNRSQAILRLDWPRNLQNAFLSLISNPIGGCDKSVDLEIKWTFNSSKRQSYPPTTRYILALQFANIPHTDQIGSTPYFRPESESRQMGFQRAQSKWFRIFIKIKICLIGSSYFA